MNRPPKTEWIVPVLSEIAAFLAVSGLKDSSEAVVEAIAAVLKDTEKKQETRAARTLVSEPLISGNVVRFSVVSRRGS